MNTFTFFMIWTFMSSPSNDFKIKTLPRQEQKFVKNVLKMHKWEELSNISLTENGIMMDVSTIFFLPTIPGKFAGQLNR